MVRVGFDDLRRTGLELQVWVNLRDGRGRTNHVGVEAAPGDRGGTAWLMGDRGQDRRCRVRHRIRYARDVVRVWLPRTCLGSPTVGPITWTRWIAAG